MTDIDPKWRNPLFGHLERRFCTEAAPMPVADKDRFFWGHPDAEVTGRFFNLDIARCPHCGLEFTCYPKGDA